ncbi:MAG TPA: tetratricopeptide repeat protein [Flavobacteriales bacterium]|nr:tetratricopeptide repeat protein [Flavobacteriales bacterium]HIN39209.1 tetratricopeptide repeat protein [Flavobacteriales bacterium]
MIRIFKIFICVLFLLSCSSIKKGQEAKTENQQKGSLSAKDKVHFDKVFYAANRAKILGDYDEAADLFAQCVRKDPSNAASIYELSNIYLHLGKLKESLFFIKKAAAISPDNIWYQLALAKNYYQNKLFDKSIKVYGSIVKNQPQNIEAHYEMAGIMVQAGNLNDAIKEYNKIEKKIGVVEDIILQKELIYIQLNKVDKAIDEMNKLIASAPKEPRYYGMLAELYQANGFDDKAMATYKKLLQLSPDDAYAHLSLANFYRRQGKEDLYIKEMKIVFGSKTMSIDKKIEILFPFYSLSENNAGKTNHALVFCRLLIATHPNEAKAHAMYADFLYREGKLEKALEEYRLVINIDKSKFLIWKQLIQVELELKEFESMLTDSEEAIELFPNQSVLYLYNGIANIQIKSFDAAIVMLKKGVSLTLDNNFLLTSFYSNLGDSYHSTKDTGASDLAYDKALEYDPNNIYVLNNYSYYLSLRGKELEKARKMASKSIELEPKNISFQDTYGWVLYKSGNYKEAKIWINKSLNNGGNQRPVILEHYGDVLYMLGQKEEALKYWNEAKLKGGKSKLLEKKIQDKKLYENP